MLLSTPTRTIAWQAPDFSLPDPDGDLFSLEDLMGENGLLVAFICNHCPYVQAIVDRFAADAETLQSEGIGVVAVMSNDYRYLEADSPPNMKRFAEDHGFSFPYLVDEDQSVGKSFGAVCTPDFFGFDRAGELQYRGRLDDARMGDATHRVPELLNAMREIAATGKGPETQLPSMGCSIKWR
ncbi:MAG: thioredoxin family protein [Holophagales bacterium]|nr:thioredoxin family protein [Holophagales bacterium]